LIAHPGEWSPARAKRVLRRSSNRVGRPHAPRSLAKAADRSKRQSDAPHLDPEPPAFLRTLVERKKFQLALPSKNASAIILWRIEQSAHDECGKRRRDRNRGFCRASAPQRWTWSPSGSPAYTRSVAGCANFAGHLIPQVRPSYVARQANLVMCPTAARQCSPARARTSTRPSRKPPATPAR